MRASLERIAMKTLSLVAMALLVTVAGNRAHAQFQAIFGGTWGDVARGGVIQTSDGNIIMVGHSASFSPTFESDVYVIKTDRCGGLIWARTYDIGGFETGKKIRELNDGSLVIVGYTENTRNCCTRNDAFLMRITSTGDSLWTKTYGGLNNDVGNDVIYSPAHDALFFAGATESFTHGLNDGWLMRTDLNGTVQWSRTYGEALEDLFNTLDIDCDGDLMAAGASRSFNAGDEDIWIVWADVNTGLFQRGVHLGGNGDDGAWSLVTFDNFVFYLVGYTNSLTNGINAYAMRGECATGNVIVDAAYTSAGVVGEDQFTEIRKLPNGNLITTGFVQNNSVGYGGYDVHLAELDQNVARVRSTIYGGAAEDRGWTVAVVDPMSNPYRIVQAGHTASFSTTPDIYEILSTNLGASLCNYKTPKIDALTPNFIADPVTLSAPLILVQCPAKVDITPNTSGTVLCTNCAVNNDAQQDLSRVSPPHDRINSGSASVNVSLIRNTRLSVTEK